jgi:single-stranded DNA-specific DHH superfamily exonuclease
MLSKKQINKIKEHLERAQNPLFLFDNDPDGLCSFLLLQRFCKKGKGFPIKSFPELDESYFRKVLELNADYIFILDKPLVSKDFFKEALEKNIPVVWIDHHKPDKKDFFVPREVDYYNSYFRLKDKGVPVTQICWEITKQKSDAWIALIGIISDCYFLKEPFEITFEKYPELLLQTKEPFRILYETEIGKLSRIFNAGLRYTITNSINMMKFLMNAKSPYDILEKDSKNKFIWERYDFLDSKFKNILEKFYEKKEEYGDLIYFEYAGEMSISSEIANYLSFKYPKKKIVVIYRSSSKLNISARGKNIRKLILKVVKDLPYSTAGGHKDAVGGQVPEDQLSVFKEKLLFLSK